MITEVNVQALADYIIEGEKLKKQVTTLLAVIEQCEVALEWNVNGFTLREYLKVQFPATIGHIPLEIHLDKLESALVAIKKVKESK